jgi:hypothetical protein
LFDLGLAEVAKQILRLAAPRGGDRVDQGLMLALVGDRQIEVLGDLPKGRGAGDGEDVRLKSQRALAKVQALLSQ